MCRTDALWELVDSAAPNEPRRLVPIHADATRPVQPHRRPALRLRIPPAPRLGRRSPPKVGKAGISPFSACGPHRLAVEWSLLSLPWFPIFHEKQRTTATRSPSKRRAILRHPYFLSDLPEGIGAFFQLGLTIVMPGGRSPRCLFSFDAAFSTTCRDRLDWFQALCRCAIAD